MLVQTYHPKKLSAQSYDRYLEKGWFRGAYLIYKVDIVCLEEQVLSVVNIRINLADYQPKKRMAKLMRRNARNFTFRVQPATINGTKEELYDANKHRFQGFIYPSLYDNLFSHQEHKPFEMWEIEVYEGERLVAVSYFDLGKNSMAGLMSISRPGYEKYSLGTYTMLLELEYAQERNLDFYYPGYVMDKSTKFDYKLRVGTYEYLSESGQWLPNEELDPNLLSGNVLRQKMAVFGEILSAYECEYKSYLYPHFALGYLPDNAEQYVRMPLFFILDSDTEGMLLAGYDVDEKEYIVQYVETPKENDPFFGLEKSKEIRNNDAYMQELLVVREEICRAATPELLSIFQTFAGL